MHEMSLCEGIREVIVDQAARHSVARISRVRLEIGRFSGVEKPALEFAFDVVMRGTPAEGAALVFIDIPGRGWCYDCMKDVTIEDRLAPCPDCGGAKVLATGGDELRIKDMEAQ